MVRCMTRSGPVQVGEWLVRHADLGRAESKGSRLLGHQTDDLEQPELATAVECILRLGRSLFSGFSNLRVPRNEFVAAWALAEELADDNWYAAGVAKTCRWVLAVAPQGIPPVGSAPG